MARISLGRARDLLIWGSERALTLRARRSLFATREGLPLARGAALGPLNTDEVTPLGGTLTLRPAKSYADYSPLGHIARERILVLRTLFISRATYRPHISNVLPFHLLKRPKKGAGVPLRGG